MIDYDCSTKTNTRRKIGLVLRLVGPNLLRKFIGKKYNIVTKIQLSETLNKSYAVLRTFYITGICLTVYNITETSNRKLK